MVFERKGKGKVTFSHRQHNKAQTRFVVVNNYLTLLIYGTGQKSSIGFQKACNPFQLLVIEDFCYIPRQELRGTPQEAKYRTPSDLPTNISLFHLLYYLI